jgi:hypothetical protein
MVRLSMTRLGPSRLNRKQKGTIRHCGSPRTTLWCEAFFQDDPRGRFWTFLRSIVRT